MADQTLPDKNSPHIFLDVATPDEWVAQRNVNSVEWKGQLSLEAYHRREILLADQELTKNDGITPWVLVFQAAEGGPRQVLCGCETIKKAAIVSRGGKVEEAVAHGVASVYCDGKLRGKGYASRMMGELGKKLKGWQGENGKQVAFSVLYSDIGKKFYAKQGWYPFPSGHVHLKPTTQVPANLPSARFLTDDEIPALCAADEQLIRSRVAKRAASNRTTVAMIPDYQTIAWHNARETFVANELFKKTPVNRGTIINEDGKSGPKAWCNWTCYWPTYPHLDPNVLYILRINVDDDSVDMLNSGPEIEDAAAKESPAVQAIAAVLAKAQEYASQWGMHQVEVWNPSAVTLAAAKLLDGKAAVEHRDEESITSLQWYGEGSWEDVEWELNEKYAWC